MLILGVWIRLIQGKFRNRTYSIGKRHDILQCTTLKNVSFNVYNLGHFIVHPIIILGN